MNDGVILQNMSEKLKNNVLKDINIWRVLLKKIKKIKKKIRINNIQNNNEIDIFFTELNQAVSTTSEKIILKLKKIKIQKWLKNDNEGASDINWIINVITQENLYDLDTNIITTHWKNKQKTDDIAYLIKYSEIEGNTQKANDYKKIRKESKIYKIGIPINKQNEKKVIRRGTKLNEIISPSIISTLIFFEIFK